MFRFTILPLAPCLLLAVQIPVVDSPVFPKELQIAAVTATVQIRNAAQQMEGSGTLIGKNGSFVYILTARHVVRGAEGLEVTVFFKDSYPKPQAVYRSAIVVAEMQGLADLALLRLATTDVMPEFIPVCPERLAPTATGIISALAVGCDAGKAPTCLLEKLARKKMARRDNENERCTFWEVDRKHGSGRSGGPLINEHGYLVGVCSGSNKDKTYFTHIEEIHRFLRRNALRWLADEKARPKLP